jgi:hypothetical protein
LEAALAYSSTSKTVLAKRDDSKGPNTAVVAGEGAWVKTTLEKYDGPVV